MADPTYVKLRDELSTGIVADIDDYHSQWSISGLDVKEFPSEERAAQFVRDKIRAGAIVEASSEEFDVVNEVNDLIASARPFVSNPEPLSNWQENNIQAAAKEARDRLRKVRNGEAVDRLESVEGAFGEVPRPALPNEEQDAKRREAIIEEQKSSEKAKAKKQGNQS